MAMPLPTPVEPSFSRCCRISRIVRSLWPQSSAALAASSCRICFLLLTFSAGMMALGATRSVSSMDLFPKVLEARQGRDRKGADHKYPPGARQWASLFDCRWIDPADTTIRAAVNQIDAAMSSVTKHEEARRLRRARVHHARVPAHRR